MCHAVRVTERRPEVVAHRGANEDEPEHSLASYLLAVREGADAVECDVRLTADGTLVLVHDRRIDRTSSGRGPVSKLTVEELKRHDFSGADTWHDFEAPAPDRTRTAVLTLHSMLTALMEASDTIRFAIETKHPTRYGGYVEEELAVVLASLDLATPARAEDSRVRVMSFSARAVRRMNRLCPALPTVYLMDRLPRRRRDGSLPDGTHIAGVGIERVREQPEYVDRVHARGDAVHVWTVDDPRDVRLCLDLGADAIISNRPAMVRAVIDGR